MRFISERALSLHKEYVENERLRLSVIEKTYPELSGKCVKDILRSRCGDKIEAARLKLDIMCHERYFSSFGKHYSQSEAVRRSYVSEATFLYELGRIAESAGEKFIFIYADYKRVKVICGDEWTLLKINGSPIIIDLSEHSYFLDYGFEKGRYINNLLPYLDLSLLDKKYHLRIEK